MMRVSFTVNGKDHEVAAQPIKRLLDVLRDDLALTGVKEGCGEGECGACTVVMDGLLVLSCLVPICQVEGKHVTTIEELAASAHLHTVQKPFLATAAPQSRTS